MADDIDDLSEDAAEFRCLVPFPDGSASFVHGFEAGMIWQRMVAGEAEIAPDVAVHVANRLVYERMAAAQGYDVEFWPCPVDDGGECDTWMMVAFAKRRNRLRVVK